MDPFHISGFIRRGSRHNWVKFYSSERETTGNIIFVFLFAPISKLRIHGTVSPTSQKREKIRVISHRFTASVIELLLLLFYENMQWFAMLITGKASPQSMKKVHHNLFAVLVSVNATIARVS